MARSPSAAAADTLVDLTWTSIRHGIAGRGRVVPDLAGAPEEVQAPGAAFVTVTVGGQLNGCIGTLEPAEPLGAAVVRLAWDAAFADPRLPALTAADLPDAAAKISVLGPLEPMECASEEDLCRSLRPGVDGLLLVAGSRRATFLPAVWESLPDPIDFVHHLEAKAGLRSGWWPATTECVRYEVAEIDARPR
jgi:AmmeMemoRadiSam system protein A